MKIVLNKPEEKDWHQIICNSSLDYGNVIEWCLDYNSPYRFSCYRNQEFEFNGRCTQTMIIKFESLEDHMMFAMHWLGL
jgi:hypothetical protein